MWNEPPKLSVVIAASHSAEALRRCALSVIAGAPAAAFEVVVAAPPHLVEPHGLPAGVVWAVAQRGAAVARLRAVGLEAARGEVVAFTEDSCLAQPDWAQAWLEAFADPAVRAATGPVGHARNASPVDWAVFFCEYAPFLEPQRARPARRLAGNNFAARRRELLAARKAGGLDESAVWREASRQGRATVAPRAGVRHVRAFGLREAICDRLRLGRDYGRSGAPGEPRTTRWAKLLAGPAILLAQVGRLVGHLLTRPPVWEPFLESLPITLPLLAAWSVGEWLGRWEAVARLPHVRTSRDRAAQPQAQPPAPALWTQGGCSTAPDCA